MIFAGYQAVGTIGRALVDGAKEVKLFGESIDVEAILRCFMTSAVMQTRMVF